MESRPPSKSALLPAEAYPVASLVTYQDGSVVSRTLYANEAGTVTLFAFADGQGLSEHTAPFDALVHILEGQAQITIAGKGITASAGEMVLMPAHQPHALKASTAFKMLLIMIRAR